MCCVLAVADIAACVRISYIDMQKPYRADAQVDIVVVKFNTSLARSRDYL